MNIFHAFHFPYLLFPHGAYFATIDKVSIELIGVRLGLDHYQL
jgi:hypothetical protein